MAANTCNTANMFPQYQGKSDSVASCPLTNVNTRVECDVNDLKLSVKEIEKKQGSKTVKKTHKATANKKLTTENVFNKLDPKKARELKSYDHVIEVMADGPGAYDPSSDISDAAENIIQLVPEATPLGNCPTNQHIKIKVDPIKTNDPNGDTREWINSQPAEQVYMANSNPGDQAGPARFLAPFWCFVDNTKELVVSAEGCGVRKQGKPVKQLKFLVRIYPKDQYSLSLTIPSAYTHKREARYQRELFSSDLKGNKRGASIMEFSTESKSWNGVIAHESRKTVRNSLADTNYHERTSGTRNQGGGFTSQSEKIGRKEGADHLVQSETYNDSSRNPLYSSGGTYSYTDSINADPELLFELNPVEIKPTISFKRNNNELDLTKAINDIINLKHTITKTFNEIQNWVPKIGWSVSLEIALFEGKIIGDWGNRHPKMPIDPRYFNIESYYAVDFQIKVVEVGLTFMLGVDFSIPDLLSWFNNSKVFALILKAEGKITSGASVGQKLTHEKLDPVAIKGEGKFEASVHGRVEVVGYVAEAKGGVVGGITFVGALKVSLRQAPTFDGKFIREESHIYAFYTIRREKRTSKPYKRVLWDKKDPLWEL